MNNAINQQTYTDRSSNHQQFSENFVQMRKMKNCNQWKWGPWRSADFFRRCKNSAVERDFLSMLHSLQACCIKSKVHLIFLKKLSLFILISATSDHCHSSAKIASALCRSSHPDSTEMCSLGISWQTSQRPGHASTTPVHERLYPCIFCITQPTLDLKVLLQRSAILLHTWKMNKA